MRVEGVRVGRDFAIGTMPLYFLFSSMVVELALVGFDSSTLGSVDASMLSCILGKCIIMVTDGFRQKEKACLVELKRRKEI